MSKQTSQTLATSPISELAFEDAVRRVVDRFQQACAALLDALPSYPRTSQELTSLLGVDKNLAWKVFRLVGERDLLAAGRFVLGAQALGIFLRAAAEQGVPQTVLDGVRDAALEFEEVVRIHAGDRASIEMMLASTGNAPDESTEIALRRAAFRSNSYFVGVQARTQLQTFMLAPSKAPGMTDGVAVRGYVDLRRMRTGAPVVIGRSRCTDDGGIILPPFAVEPLDDGVAIGRDVPLIREFCSEPTPVFRRTMGEHGFVEDELVEGPIGRQGSTTCVLGECMRAMTSRFATERDRNFDMVASVRTPCEVLLCDYLVHEELFGPVRPQVRMFCDMAGMAMRRVEGREQYQHAIHERIEHLGKAPRSAQTADVPRYSRLIEHTMNRMGWDSGRFDLFRVRIEYPFIPSSVVISHPLPQATGQA